MAEEPVKEQANTSEPPRVNPLAKPVAATTKTIALHPVSRGSTQTGLKPGLRLPPKPGMPTAGLKLPTQNAIRPGMRLPTQNALRPGIKLPPKPGINAGTLKLPTRPSILRPGATVPAKPLPKPVSGAAAAVSAPAENAVPAEATKTEPTAVTPVKQASVATASVPTPAPAPAQAPAVPDPEAKAPEKPAAPAPTTPKLVKPITRPLVKPIVKPGVPHATKPLAPPLPKPIAPLPKPVSEGAPKTAETPAPAVQAETQGVTKLPTVEMQAVPREDVSAAAAKPLDQLKSVTQRLKGVTQQIPQQAILRKTGIIAEDAMTAAQKEAAKHKTARISLSDAMGVAPVKAENAPMKTIRIRRPIDIPGATTEKLAPKPTATPASSAEAVAPATSGETPPKEDDATSITQRKTLKIARPGGGIVRPTGKFGIKRPGALAVKRPSSVAPDSATGAKQADTPVADQTVADIADIPDMPMVPVPAASAPANDGPAWLWGIATVAQLAACAAIGALAWFLWQNTQGIF